MISRFVLFNIFLWITSFCFIGGGSLNIYGYLILPVNIFIAYYIFPKLSYTVWCSSTAFVLYLFLIFCFLTSFDINRTYSLFVRFSPILFFKIYRDILYDYPELKTISKKFVYLWFGALLFFCYKSFVYLQSNPMGLREIVSIAKDDTVAIGGGFALPYALCIFIPFLVNKLKQGILNNLFEKGLWILFIVVGVCLVAMSLYMTALVLLSIGVVWSFVKDYSAQRRVVFAILILFITFICYEYVPMLLKYISGEDTMVLMRRFDEIDSILRGNDISKSKDFYSRLTRSFSSLLLFLENPFIGVGYKVSYNSYELENLGVGSHAQWFDILAIYGAFAFLLIYYLVRGGKDVYTNGKVNLTLSLFIILGFLNPVFQFTIIFVAFFLSPLINMVWKCSSEQ